MTHAADSAARQVTHGESEREQPATDAVKEFGDSRAGTSSHLPVFAAFVELGLTGRDVALFADVTPPTVSKWRAGKTRIPDEKLAFLTLVLAHLLDETQAIVDLEAECASAHGTWSTQWGGRLDAARAYLVYQDVLNQPLAAARVREGAQLFRAWWASGAAQRLQEKRFAPILDRGLESDRDTEDKVQDMRRMT